MLRGFPRRLNTGLIGRPQYPVVKPSSFVFLPPVAWPFLSLPRADARPTQPRRDPLVSSYFRRVLVRFVPSRFAKEMYGTLNMVLSYISRDAAGAPLGNCRVMIFRTEDMSFVGETTSDASGNWSLSMMKGGPFFFVEYKAGSPDRAGTSLNTLVPVQA